MYPIPLSQSLTFPDDILSMYGKTMTWDIKAQLMGMRTSPPLTVPSPVPTHNWYP